MDNKKESSRIIHNFLHSLTQHIHPKYSAKTVNRVEGPSTALIHAFLKENLQCVAFHGEEKIDTVYQNSKKLEYKTWRNDLWFRNLLSIERHETYQSMNTKS